MKKIKYYLVGAVLCAAITGLSGCKLESETYDSIPGDKFPTTEADAEAIVTANAYGVFRSAGYDGMFNVANGVLLVSDLLSDYGECSWRQWEPLLYVRFTNGSNMNTQADVVSSLWSWSEFMGKMTMNIDRIKNMDIDEDVKNKYLAELSCARGWLAFCMWDLFGPIPLPTLEALKDPLKEQIFPRATEEEMRQFIVDELTSAANVLPYSYDKDSEDYGRFTKGLCNTILMKFYMQIGDWPNAVEMGKELQKAEYGYEIFDGDYADLFAKANEKNKETIWAVNCLRGTQEHKWHPHVLPNDYPHSDNLTKWNGWKVSWDFMNTFEPNDKRLETIAYEYVGTDGIVHNQTEDRKSTGNKLYYGAVPIKYDCKDFAGTMGEDSETDYIIYRFADVQTMLAEAMVRNGSPVDDVLYLVNPIRKRAGLSEWSSGDFASTDDFLDALLLERGHEFIYEGVRRQDLIRYGKYVDAIKQKALFAGQTTLVNSNYYRIPLPQSVIDEGKGLIVNNPGY